jgi:tetratricopeptide (TPR) repeat protein
VSGTNQHSWLSADDDTVRQKLQAALRHAQSAGTPSEILGSPQPTQYRAAFLQITKTYHPNRFARRPEDIRRLANEVYILLKEAYESVKEASIELERAEADRRLLEAKAAAAKAPRKRSPSTGAGKALPDPAVLATRRAMMNRRQAELKQGLGNPGTGPASGGTGKRTAQVRAAADPKTAQSDSARRAEEEQRFQRALNQMRITDFVTAATTFKELAVGRPSEKRFRMHMHYAQGRVQQAMGQHEEARAEYKRALGLDADFAEAHQAMETLPGGKSAKSILKSFFKK